MSQYANWEAEKMLDVYIYDYLEKKGFKNLAQAFHAEANVSTDIVAIHERDGFLLEWWSVFWDLFIARHDQKHSEAAAAYLETQRMKAKEEQQQLLQPQQSQNQQQLQPQQSQNQQQQQQLQPQQSQNQQQQQQILLQQQLLQRQVQQLQQPQQQHRDGVHLIQASSTGLAGSNPLMRQNPGDVNASATKILEDNFKLPVQRDYSEQRFGENVSQLMEPFHASILKPAAAIGQTAGSSQLLHGTAGGMTQLQARSQQLPGSALGDISQLLNSRAVGSEGSLIGNPGLSQSGNNLTLKGWPLTVSGLDQLRPGILQPQKPFMQGHQPFSQLQMACPQSQINMLLANQSMASSSSALEERRLRMMMANRGISIGNSAGDMVPNLSSSLQSSAPMLSRGDTELLMKLKLAQLQQQQSSSSQQQQQSSSSQQQSHQHSLANQPSQSVTLDGSTSFRGNDQTGRKRKQPLTFSGPVNSSGTINTAGPSTSSAPSTPSTHTPGDTISVPAHIGTSSKPMAMFGADGAGPAGTFTSLSNPLGNMDRFMEDGALDNVESFLSQGDTDSRDSAGCIDANKAFSFTESNSIRASTSKIICCHFSADGKLLASGGHDKKAVLWYTDGLKVRTTLEEHSALITDVRFGPSTSRLATSSFDKTVRVWDAESPGFSLRTFTGHGATVMSLDFHPNKEDIVCSCDGDGEIRYWSVNNGSCPRVFKGATSQVRFQPRHGKYLAAAAENVASILDVETQACLHKLQGHAKPIHSVCWDPSGELLASVSEDSVKVWKLGSGGEGECVHELSCNGNKFHSCVFHPTYSSLLVIGCYQSLELWNMSESKTITLPAHEGLIADLAASSVSGFVASVSHDKVAKLWK